MHICELLTLGMHLLLSEGVNSLRYSFLENQISSLDNVDNILGQFIADFNKAYLSQDMSRNVVVIGAFADQLRQFHSLIESHPHIICNTDPEICFRQKLYDSQSFVIVFLEDFDEKSFEKTLGVLSIRGTECEHLFIFEGIGSESRDFSSFLSRMIARGVAYNRLAHLDKNVVKLYVTSYAPKCSVGIELASVWEPGTDLSKINFATTLRDMNGCPIPVGTFQYMPKMIFGEKENGSSTIAGGMDGMLVLLIAQELNFTIDLKHPSMPQATENSTRFNLLRNVELGNVAFGVSRLRPTNILSLSMSYADECLTWAVPRISSNSENIIWTEFPWRVWVLIGSVFVCSCFVGYLNFSMTSRRDANRGGVGFVTIMLDVLSINLGNPSLVHAPIFMGGKLMLMASLYYALVTTTAYKSSLASILTRIPISPMITNSREILEAGLKVGGSSHRYDILEDQAADSDVVSELIKRYVIYENQSDALHRVAYDKDFVLLARRSSLEYEKWMTVKGGRLIRFDILDECVLTYPVGIIFIKGHPLLKPVNKILSHVVESGIMGHWNRGSYVDDKILEQQNSDRFYEMYMRRKFKNIFVLYIGCITVCLLVFFIEIISVRFKLKKRQEIARGNDI